MLINRIHYIKLPITAITTNYPSHVLNVNILLKPPKQFKQSNVLIGTFQEIGLLCVKQTNRHKAFVITYTVKGQFELNSQIFQSQESMLNVDDKKHEYFFPPSNRNIPFFSGLAASSNSLVSMYVSYISQLVAVTDTST